MKNILIGVILLFSLFLNAREIEEIQKACENNVLMKCVEVGMAYEYGFDDLKKDHEKSILFYKKACDGGASQGCIYLAYLYDRGDGIEKNKTKVKELKYKAKNIATEACKLNNAMECANLGVMYSIGNVTIKDDFKAIKFYKKSCDLNDAGGCTLLGESYFDGEGVRQNYSSANKFFKKSCILGNYFGCIRLADAYVKGLGIKKDTLKALKLYGDACDAGFSEGCKKYAILNKKQ